MRLAQLFILGVAGALALLGFVLVNLNKDSLGAVALITYIGVVVMAVSLKISSYLLRVPRQPIGDRQYGDIMDWAIVFFVWPCYAIPLVVLPWLIGNVAAIAALFLAGIAFFVAIGLWGLKISADRISGKRRYAKWFYFIPAFLYTIPALVIGWFVVNRFAAEPFFLRLANYGGLLLGAFFSFYCVKLALFDLFDWQSRRYRLADFLPLALAIMIVAIAAEWALPLFAGKAAEIYLLYTLSLYALAAAQLLGVLSVSRRAGF